MDWYTRGRGMCTFIHAETQERLVDPSMHCWVPYALRVGRQTYPKQERGHGCVVGCANQSKSIW